MPLTKLSEAWITASEHLKEGWELTGVVRGGRDGGHVDHERGELAWVAYAGSRRMAEIEEVIGVGSTPYEALTDLADKLAALKGTP